MSNKLEEIFLEELVEDLPRLDEWISKRDSDAIYRLAHKYKVRISHTRFKYLKGKCLEIEDLYHAKSYNQMITLATKFKELLQNILNEAQV